MRFEWGHRYSRRFGADRFLELTIPQLRGTATNATEDEALARWLATCLHYACGRTWRSIYLERQKTSKKKRKNDYQVAKVVLFATEGSDFIRPLHPPDLLDIAATNQPSSQHTPMTVDALINWLIPFDSNRVQPDLKLFQRIHLGLSRTLPTAILRKTEVFSVNDMKSPTGETMNDGCALMSRSLARHVADSLNLGTIPAAFQARLAGAKGVWIVDKSDHRHPSTRGWWIELNDSQLKILPAPDKTDKLLDDEQLTFAVVKWYDHLSPADLNVQVLQVLQHGGLQRSHMQALLEHEIELAYHEFKSVVKPRNTLQTRKWLQRWLGPTRASRNTPKQAAEEIFPMSNAMKALALIDAGFQPLEVRFLGDVFTALLRDYFEKLELPRI
ncbi:hypothetical protein KEM52_000698, partial [Ascosphaera acerosa]